MGGVWLEISKLSWRWNEVCLIWKLRLLAIAKNSQLTLRRIGCSATMQSLLESFCWLQSYYASALKREVRVWLICKLHGRSSIHAHILCAHSCLPFVAYRSLSNRKHVVIWHSFVHVHWEIFQSQTSLVVKYCIHSCSHGPMICEFFWNIAIYKKFLLGVLVKLLSKPWDCHNILKLVAWMCGKS